MNISFEKVSKHILIIALIAVFFAGFSYICFYLPLNRSDANEKIEGVVKDKWVDITESQTGTGFSLKALVESENGGQYVITVDRKTHDQIKIGNIVKRDGNGELKILK